MDLYAIDIKKYKAIFFQTQLSNILFILGAYLLLKNGMHILSEFDPGKKLTLPILLIMVVLAAFHTQYQKKQLARLRNIGDFDLRIEEYKKFYKFRLLWFFFSCFTSCILAVLTARYFFLYYAVFDVLISLPYYPSLFLFKRELQNDDIIFY